MPGIETIRRNVDTALSRIVGSTIRIYKLDRIAPEMCSGISDFTLRKGKRIRPLLFSMGYLGYVREPACGFYYSAAAVELFHSFILIHDDVIDKAELRRGRPALHVVYRDALRRSGGAKGEDLSIVAGDLVYSMAISSFLKIREESARKELALRKVLETAFYTGSGQFIELVNDRRPISQIGLDEIYRTYDLKTASYTFAGPLAAGALLAGAHPRTASRLYRSGLLMGRAFQIRDDILDIFGDELNTGKTIWKDIEECKKTVLLWHAYHYGNSSVKKYLRRLLEAEQTERPVTHTLKQTLREILIGAGSLAFAESEITRQFDRARIDKAMIGMDDGYGKLLGAYSRSLLEN